MNRRSAIASFVNLPCLNRARRMRSIPSAIFGPVLNPPPSGLECCGSSIHAV